MDSSAAESSLLAPFDGHFEPRLREGRHVTREQGIGFLHDFNRLDDPPAVIRMEPGGGDRVEPCETGMQGRIAGAIRFLF